MSNLDTALALRGEPAFAHASEAEFARILDFYQVAWHYEPEAFPILWDLDGNVLESFAPDFYLPDLELFVEMTTLQQHLVRKKNRKVRRLRELYPALRIKLFYARDFRALMLKYGRAALVAELSGAPGQVMPRPEQQPATRDLDVAAGPDRAAVGLNPGIRADSARDLNPAPERRSRAARRRAGRKAAAARASSSHVPAQRGIEV